MYTINIYADTVEGGDPPPVNVDSDAGWLELSINDDSQLAALRCSGCGEETDIANDEPCDGSSNFIDCVEHALDDDGDCEHCDGSGQIEVHEWEPTPLAWCNSASIHWDPGADRVKVALSVDDPRGAFVLEVTRNSDGELRMSVPHATMSTPHMPLQERSPGWFKIGH